MRSAHILAPYRFISHDMDRRLTRAVYVMAPVLANAFGVLIAISQHMA